VVDAVLEEIQRFQATSDLQDDVTLVAVQGHLAVATFEPTERSTPTAEPIPA